MVGGLPVRRRNRAGRCVSAARRRHGGCGGPAAGSEPPIPFRVVRMWRPVASPDPCACEDWHARLPPHAASDPAGRCCPAWSLACVAAETIRKTGCPWGKDRSWRGAVKRSERDRWLERNVVQARADRFRRGLAQCGLRPGGNHGYTARPADVRRCCSSVVEHSLGKGEVESSIPSSSTTPSGRNPC